MGIFLTVLKINAKAGQKGKSIIKKEKDASVGDLEIWSHFLGSRLDAASGVADVSGADGLLAVCLYKKMTLCLKELESVVRRVFLTLVRPARHAHEGGAHVAEGVVHVRAVGVGQAGDAGAGGGAEGGAGAERLDALLVAGAGGAVARDAAGRIDHADGGHGHVSRAHAVCAREKKTLMPAQKNQVSVVLSHVGWPCIRRTSSHLCCRGSQSPSDQRSWRWPSTRRTRPRPCRRPG